MFRSSTCPEHRAGGQHRPQCCISHCWRLCSVPWHCWAVWRCADSPRIRRASPACCRCQLIQGTPVLKGSSGYGEHVWVAKDELGEYIDRPQVLELLQKML